MRREAILGQHDVERGLRTDHLGPVLGLGAVRRAVMRAAGPTPIEHRPVTAAAATASLRDLAGSLWRFDERSPPGDLEPREQAEWWAKMIRDVYARITVVGTAFVEA
jgi:hypothetical protein